MTSNTADSKIYDFAPDESAPRSLVMSDAIVERYGLASWAEGFSLMTAGYRDHLDPSSAASPDVPFNLLTVALMAEAKARVFNRKLDAGQQAHVHLGGEVRPHTQAFIQVMARVYAANGIRVHLSATSKTTPIWASSFGIFYEEYQSGDNLTASHSPYFKGGWKPLDAEGKQLVEEEPLVVQEVRSLVERRATIELASWSDRAILHDFDIGESYVRYVRSVLGTEVLAAIGRGADEGVRFLVTPLGGSMKAATERVFELLGMPTGPGKMIEYFLDSEDSRFHRVGEHDGENFGADPCKSEIYKHLGAAEKLARGDAHCVAAWDPDGDRFNVISTLPDHAMARAREMGLAVEADPATGTCLAYLSPNQLYLLVADYRIRTLRATGQLEAYDWFVGLSFPTAKAIEELANSAGLPVFRVPVGFKNMGDLCRTLESQRGGPGNFEDTTGRRTDIGPEPRAIIFCEESGGATLGPAEPLVSTSKAKTMLAMREKDGMALALMTFGLLIDSRERGISLAERYCDLLESSGVVSRFYVRRDVALYDESLTGSELKESKTRGVSYRDKVVEFFRRLVTGFRSEELSSDAIADQVAALASGEQVRLPRVLGAAWIGDGSLFELEHCRVIVRASGTDAVMRYYVEARTRAEVDGLTDVLASLKI